MSRVLTILFGVVLVLGLALIGYGFVFDPFNTPFQDYELIPQDVQAAYEQESEAMRDLRHIGLITLLVSFVALASVFVIRK